MTSIEAATTSPQRRWVAQRVAALRERVVENQSGSSGRFLLFKHDPTGLGAQLSRRALALRIGLMTGRTALFPDEDFYPYENAYRSLSAASCDIEGAQDLDLAAFGNDASDVAWFDFWRFWEDEPLKAKVYRYVPPELEGLEDPSRVFEGLAFDLFELTEPYREEMAPYLSQLGDAAATIGVHYRRGDKYVETPYVSAERYRAAIDAVSAETGMGSIFLTSDSPHAVKELKLDDGKYNVFFDTTEKRYNNANHRFLMNNRDLSHQETFTAIKNIYMLSCCGRIVGQTNAHFASLAFGTLMARGNLAPGILLKPELEPKSASMKLVYSAYRASRDLAKRILPQLLIHRSRRR